MLEALLLLTPLLIGAFVYDAMRVREAAIGIARAACERQGLQFLDFTVQRARLRLVRTADGHAALQRTYGFEFSEDGNHRRSGTIVMCGGVVESLQFDSYRPG